MPTYLYQCSRCGHEVEYFQSMSEGPKKKCPACGELGLVRQIGTGAGFIFKGSGFYETDYRSESYTKGAEAEKQAASGGDAKQKSDSSGKSKSDSKPKQTD
ncbi:MAG: zinc ribbon domain-containing protein [Planctomycetota bacterium]